MFAELAVGLLSLIVLWVILDNYFPSKRLPPGPFRLPIIGNALNLVLNKPKPPFVTFRDFSRKYGPVSYVRVGSMPVVIFDNFDTCKALLNNEVWIDRPLEDFYKERSFGKVLGIIFSSGEGWREMRRFSMRTLRDFGYGKATSMQRTIEEETTALLAQVEKVASSKEPVLSVKHLFTMPVLDILWSMVSSVRTAEDDVKLRKLVQLVEALTKATPMGGTILDVLPELRHIAPDLTGATFIRKCFKGLQDYFRELLETRRKEGVGDEDNRDWIDSFIKEIDKHKKLGTSPNHYTDEQFITTITDLFEAGSETSSNTLEFAMYYAMKDPKVQKKVQDEIDKVVGRNRLPTTADRPQMPYTEATLMEVQRISNVLPVTIRTSTEDTVVDNFQIAKGTLGIFNIYSIHMDESFWGDPFTFRPERFLDSNNSIIPFKAARVIPFGAGKRVCLGEQMARTTLFAYFTALLQSYSFEPVKDPEFDKIPEDPKKPEEAMFRKYVHVGFTLSPYPYETKLIKRN